MPINLIAGNLRFSQNAYKWVPFIMDNEFFVSVLVFYTSV